MSSPTLAQSQASSRVYFRVIYLEGGGKRGTKGALGLAWKSRVNFPLHFDIRIYFSTPWFPISLLFLSTVEFHVRLCRGKKSFDAIFVSFSFFSLLLSSFHLFIFNSWCWMHRKKEVKLSHWVQNVNSRKILTSGMGPKALSMTMNLVSCSTFWVYIRTHAVFSRQIAHLNRTWYLHSISQEPSLFLFFRKRWKKQYYNTQNGLFESIWG